MELAKLRKATVKKVANKSEASNAVLSPRTPQALNVTVNT